MRKLFASALVAALALVAIPNAATPVARAQEWSLKEAAAPYAGTEIKAFFLERPGYVAAQEMIPEFEAETGIKVTWDVTPYENSLEKQTLDFTGGTAQFDVVLIDVVWVGNFGANGWVTPLETFYNDPALTDPNLNLDGFFPILLESFGTWDGTVYGLPFDNYSGLLYYNRCMLEEAGFDGPPNTWMELKDTYGPALTKDGKYAFALQSRRGETQSADSFMRVIWPFGGSLLNEDFTSNLSSPESLAGLQFRQDLMQYMPPDIVSFDHDETVQALAQGQVAMITEWSAFYATLSNPETSQITDCLGITVEPEGPAGRRPALGGFSLGVNATSSPEKQAAAWLFIQWITSEAKAKEYAERGGVSGRQSVYADEEMVARFSHYPALAESWENYGNPVFRPRFPEWPAISDVIAQYGTEMMLGSISIEDGVAAIEEQMSTILSEYTNGGLPKLQ
jgi:multiple sugar transport system substrate-binding protein